MIIRPNSPGGMIRVGALWTWERLSKFGKVLDVQKAFNTVPNQGLNHILDVAFHAATQIDPWYCLLWSSDYTPLAADTYAVPGYTEFQAYNEANRVEFKESAAAAGVLSNAGSRAIFTMTVESMIYGSAMVGGGGAASTKADTAGGGTLVSSVRMGVPQIYHIGEVIRVTASFTMVSA